MVFWFKDSESLINSARVLFGIHVLTERPSLTVFKGHDIDPKDLQPFHFDDQSQNACCQGTEYLEKIVQRRDISDRRRNFSVLYKPNISTANA